MKIYQSIYYTIIGCFLGGVLVTSCLNDSTPESFFTTLATVDMQTDNQIGLQSDTYGTLTLKNPGVLVAADADSTGQRILAGIQFLEETSTENQTPVQLVEIMKVLTKRADDLREEGSEDVYGHDAIQITSASISKEHLNIQYEIGNATPSYPHRISLILTEETQPDKNGLLTVEFRHNAGEDMGTDRLWGIVSYTLSSIPDYDTTRIKGFKIKYNSGADSQAEWIVKAGNSNNQSQQKLSRSEASATF